MLIKNFIVHIRLPFWDFIYLYVGSMEIVQLQKNLKFILNYQK